MQIHIAAAAMVRGKMKDGIHAFHRGARHARFAQVRLDEFDFAVGDVLVDLSQMPAGQIVDDAHFRAACQQLIRQRRTDE